MNLTIEEIIEQTAHGSAIATLEQIINELSKRKDCKTACQIIKKIQTTYHLELCAGGTMQ